MVEDRGVRDKEGRDMLGGLRELSSKCILERVRTFEVLFCLEGRLCVKILVARIMYI